MLTDNLKDTGMQPDTSEKADAKTEKAPRLSKLAKEILGFLGVSVIIALFFFGALRVGANALILSYCDANGILLTEMQEYTYTSWINALSFASALVIFLSLFLLLLGQKLTYLRSIIQGIHALRTHRMDFTIPLEGENEFTELAASINFLAETERDLKEKEALMQEEREEFIRNLSHDIRTPLTSILAYTEYLQSKGDLSQEETDIYLELVQSKSQQMKTLTDRLLDSTIHTVEHVENGRLLMQQLAADWSFQLEDRFDIRLDIEDCPDFSGDFDIAELQRIFDNLASNIEKYADVSGAVEMRVFADSGFIVIQQKNAIRTVTDEVQESRKVGLESIRRIAESYGGKMDVIFSPEFFKIKVYIGAGL